MRAWRKTKDGNCQKQEGLGRFLQRFLEKKVLLAELDKGELIIICLTDYLILSNSSHATKIEDLNDLIFELSTSPKRLG